MATKLKGEGGGVKKTFFAASLNIFSIGAVFIQPGEGSRRKLQSDRSAAESSSLSRGQSMVLVLDGSSKRAAHV